MEWIDGGSPDKYGLSVDVTGWNFSGIARWPVTDQFDAFAKLGALMWDAEYQGFEIEDTDSSDLWIASAVWRF